MAEDKVRSAGVSQPERLAAGMSDRAIAKAAKEILSSFRVYVLEWLHDSRHATREAAEAAEAAFAGRLDAGGTRISADPLDGTWVLETRRWNVRAEFKSREVAEDVARLLAADGEETEVVERNARREHLLLSYGILRRASPPAAPR